MKRYSPISVANNFINWHFHKTAARANYRTPIPWEVSLRCYMWDKKTYQIGLNIFKSVSTWLLYMYIIQYVRSFTCVIEVWTYLAKITIEDANGCIMANIWNVLYIFIKLQFSTNILPFSLVFTKIRIVRVRYLCIASYLCCPDDTNSCCCCQSIFVMVLCNFPLIFGF